ncbi:MAG: (2Fe-2S) ferredoxin domain-containing protein [Polyangiaceae bacterium]|nr:(2Fe-2S) ferredoxin domain-containing protein [Polyangiaceae bacterium]
MSKCYAVRPPPRRPADAFLLVCTNRRPGENPLGPGCSDRGEALHSRLSQEIGQRRVYSKIWLAKSSCLGVCPRQGAAVVLAPGGQIFSEVLPHETSGLIDLALTPSRP